MPDANFGSLERRRPSPADRQLAASEAVARMARAMYEEERALYYEGHPVAFARRPKPDWNQAPPSRREFFLAYVRRLIEKGIVLPPPPPYEGPAPMPGQQRIEA